MASTSVRPEPQIFQTRTVRDWVLAVAWLATSLASDLDAIVRHVLGRTPPTPTEPLARVAVLVAITFAIPRRERLAHLRGYVLALAALVAGGSVASQIEAHVGWFRVAQRADRMLLGVFLTLIPALFMALTLLRSGLSRRELFLVRGDMQAPAGLVLLRGVRWSALAPVLLIVISGGLIVQLWIVSHASRHLHPGVLQMALPGALLFAAINAACEEFRFRCVLLARGTRCLGPAQAVATTSVLFGLAHFGGHPSGLSGVAMAAFFAWLLARSMLDTGGWGWAWLLHFVQDIIIFLMVAMTGV